MTDTMPASWYADYRRTVEPAPEPTLKPCPFCGSVPVMSRFLRAWVVCRSCGVIGPSKATSAEAAAAWNAAPRPEENDALKARITELKDALRPFAMEMRLIHAGYSDSMRLWGQLSVLNFRHANAILERSK